MFSLIWSCSDQNQVKDTPSQNIKPTQIQSENAKNSSSPNANSHIAEYKPSLIIVAKKTSSKEFQYLKNRLQEQISPYCKVYDKEIVDTEFQELGDNPTEREQFLRIRYAQWDAFLSLDVSIETRNDPLDQTIQWKFAEATANLKTLLDGRELFQTDQRDRRGSPVWPNTTPIRTTCFKTADAIAAKLIPILKNYPKPDPHLIRVNASFYQQDELQSFHQEMIGLAKRNHYTLRGEPIFLANGLGINIHSNKSVTELTALLRDICQSTGTEANIRASKRIIIVQGKSDL